MLLQLGWPKDRLSSIAISCFITVLMTGCGSGDGFHIPADEDTAAGKVVNNPEALERRVTTRNESVSPQASGGAKAAKASRVMTLVAEVAPPSVDGHLLQATSTSMSSTSRVLVSYNTQGEPYRGGVDLFTGLNNSKKAPTLSSSLTFPDIDVSHVEAQGGYVFGALAASVDRTQFAEAGALARIVRNGRYLTLEGSAFVPLSSFAATAVASAGAAIYAVSGSTGHLFKLDAESMQELARSERTDLRWVTVDPDSGSVVALASNGPSNDATVMVFNADLQLLSSWTVPGADAAEAKNTIEVVGGRAFVAAGPEGCQIVDLLTGAIIHSIPIPTEAEAGGLSTADRVTNAVTIDEDLVFLSNGQAGVYALQAEEDLDEATDEEIRALQLLGKLQFDDAPSVNHVTYRDGVLFVAAGLGGLKIVEVDD